jgi:hypothetical protein
MHRNRRMLTNALARSSIFDHCIRSHCGFRDSRVPIRKAQAGSGALGDADTGFSRHPLARDALQSRRTLPLQASCSSSDLMLYRTAFGRIRKVSTGVNFSGLLDAGPRVGRGRFRRSYRSLERPPTDKQWCAGDCRNVYAVHA